MRKAPVYNCNPEINPIVAAHLDRKINDTIAAAMARREAAGLHVRWLATDVHPEGFSAYAKDEAQKQRWIENGKRQGWVLA